VKELKRDEELTGERPDGEAAPDELGATKTLLEEFVKRATVIEHEQQLLREDKQMLIEEFRDRIDMKTLQAALRTVKIRKTVKHRDTYDTYVSVLDPDPAT